MREHQVLPAAAPALLLPGLPTHASVVYDRYCTGSSWYRAAWRTASTLHANQLQQAADTQSSGHATKQAARWLHAPAGQNRLL